jgi:phosphotriesterase-related protein
MTREERTVGSVETVRGPVKSEDLGRTLMHEHIFILEPEALQNWGHAYGPSYWDEEERVADAVQKLTRVREAGFRTIVDPTAPGLGRYIPRIRRVAEETDLNIIVATGLYAFLELPNFLAYRGVEAIADLFVREIREGINDTGVKAAFLKCAVERHGLVGDVPRILEAIAIAAVQTGAPVMVHTNAEQRTGRLALDALTRHGVDPGRIVIAHMGDSNDLDYLRTIADAGAWLGCDRFGIDHFNPLADRIRTLVALIGEGYADRIHLSHDAASFLDFFVGNPVFANEKPDYLLITNEVLPALLDAGVTQEQIDQMMVSNPVRFFGGSVAGASASAASAAGAAGAP